MREAVEETQKEVDEIEREVEKATTAIGIVDALLGDNETSRTLIRQIVSEMMSNADWDSNRAVRKAMADRIHSFIYPPEFVGDEQ